MNQAAVTMAIPRVVPSTVVEPRAGTSALLNGGLGDRIQCGQASSRVTFLTSSRPFTPIRY
jgi:hypothetical protein